MYVSVLVLFLYLCIPSIGPPVCSVHFQVADVMETSITANLTIRCDRSKLRYELRANSTVDPEVHRASSGLLDSMDSTLIMVSDLLAGTSYDLVLELVDPQCTISTSATLLNVTTAKATPGESCIM